jgi:hypothetical protein
MYELGSPLFFRRLDIELSDLRCLRAVKKNGDGVVTPPFGA